MKDAFENIRLLLGDKSVHLYQRWFDRIQVIQKSNRVFERIESAKNREQIEDYLAEIRYALIFIGLGFEVEFEPEGNKGPDLGIKRDNENVVVEIKRIRKTDSELPLLKLDDENLELPEYGDIQQESRKTFGNIVKKFRQVKGQKGIIAIWNDDDVLDEIGSIFAVSWINTEVKNGLLTIPKDLLFILYGSKWIGNQQLYCFPFQNLLQPFETWKIEFEGENVFDHIENALSNN